MERGNKASFLFRYFSMESLVSSEWLAAHLYDVDLVILDASAASTATGLVSEYDNTRIKSARWLDLKNDFSDGTSPLPNTMATVEQFQESCRKLGIHNSSTIVVYDDLGIYWSPRVWWMFKTMGHQQIAVLEGGLPEWIKMGYKTEIKSTNTINKGDFVASYQTNSMKFFDDVKEASLNKTHIIMDARSESRFKSLEPEPRIGLRMGTIPNSVNLPYEDLLEGNVLQSNEVIEGKFQKLAKKDDDIIFSCGSGITACVLALGAEISGYKNISVYDGSWTEWGSLVD